MKKVFLVLIVVVTTSLVSAQKRKIVKSSSVTSTSSSFSSKGVGYNKGDFFVSGSFGYIAKDTGASKDGTFGFAPSLGYFIKDKIALGVSLGFKNTSSTPNGGSSSSVSEFGVGIFGRYYMKPSSQFSLFGQAGIEFASQNQSGGGNSLTRFGVAFKPGLNYFVSERFSLEATFGEVGFTNRSGGGGNSTTDFNFGLNLTQLGIGLNYKF